MRTAFDRLARQIIATAERTETAPIRVCRATVAYRGFDSLQEYKLWSAVVRLSKTQ